MVAMATCSTGALVVRCQLLPRSSYKSKVCAQQNVDWIVRKVSRALDKNKILRNAAFGAVNVIAINLPVAIAIAKEEKKLPPGKLFEFDATLPVMAVQFLLLMVALDKIWFTPLGDFMDERDESIRKKLASVQDNSEEIKKLQDEAEAVIAAARAETTAALNKMKQETAAELAEKLKESRERVEKELAEALANLEEQKQETLKNLDPLVKKITDKIIEKVLSVQEANKI